MITFLDVLIEAGIGIMLKDPLESSNRAVDPNALMDFDRAKTPKPPPEKPQNPIAPDSTEAQPAPEKIHVPLYFVTRRGAGLFYGGADFPGQLGRDPLVGINR